MNDADNITALSARHHSDERIQAFVEKVLIHSPLATKLGVRLQRLEPEYVEVLLPFDRGNVTVQEMVHGGAIASLIDIAGAIGSASNVDLDQRRGGATTSMTVNYLAAANGVDLVATGRVIQRSSRQTVTEVDVRAAGEANGPLVAKGIVTSRLF
nr:PaaI family thioesterase [Pseudomonas sp.]